MIGGRAANVKRPGKPVRWGGHSCLPGGGGLSAPEVSMSGPELNIRRRRLPHWTLDGSTYFVTFRLKSGQLSSAEIRLVLGHIRAGADRFYQLAAAVVMPDHVHLLLKPLPGFTLSRIMKGTKGVSAYLVNKHRGARGSLWQDESWDRIVRDEHEFDEKLNYMLNNPVAAGLCEDGWCYEGWFFNADFA
jgi:putative transposase